ncbi:MAG: hypothetical protein LUF92_11585 [Clostridiales bacterium]|nr:hypothetical protein [Clostridiales bacterium]
MRYNLRVITKMPVKPKCQSNNEKCVWLAFLIAIVVAAAAARAANVNLINA